VDLLENLGHEVSNVGNAEDALEALRESAFDVLLTDVSLPGMSGSELAAEAVAMMPGLKVIFATGYDQVVHQQELEEVALLRKPYTEQDIAKALSDALRR